MDKRKFRLKKGYEIKRIIRKGAWKSQKKLIVYIYNNNLKYNRIAICVSKKNGRSVDRNRLKRLVREAHRENIKNTNILGKDFVIMLRKEVMPSNTNYNDIYEDLKDAYEKLINA